MNNRRPLQFAVVCEEAVLPRWQVECVRGLEEQGLIQVRLLLLAPGARARDRQSTPKSPVRSSHMLWRLFRKISLEKQPYFQPTALAGAPRVEAVDRFREIESIEGDLDVILDFSTQVGDIDLTHKARLGVWRLCFSTFSEDPLHSAGLQELCMGEASTRVSVAAARSATDEPSTLFESVVRSELHWLPRQQAAVFRAAAHALAGACLRAKADQPLEAKTDAPTPSSETSASPASSVAAFLALGLRTGRRAVLAQGRRVFRADKWNVGVVDRPIHEFLGDNALDGVSWLPEMPRRATYLADPFVARRDGRLAILAEYYDARDRKGVICAIERMDDGRFSPPRTALDPPFHTAYPYLFEDDGRLYCAPELSREGALVLYECDSFPDVWHRELVLMADTPAVDATIFRHDGRWWVLCGLRDRDPSVNLFAFHAESLSGPWVEHPLNPVKSDVRSSRPAGTPFRHEGSLFRPAQDCSESYGSAVALNRVSQLTTTEFSETVVKVLRPAAGSRYPAGIHTLAGVGDTTVVDSKRAVLTLDKLKWRFGRKAASGADAPGATL